MDESFLSDGALGYNHFLEREERKIDSRGIQELPSQSTIQRTTTTAAKVICMKM